MWSESLNVLTTGYNFEREANMFHGGTIFCDAASKMINVKNQVSLSAGEMVMAKLCFKEWFWKQVADQVKHYCSDNGVFTAKIFKEACQDKGQAQIFSCVGT